MTDIGSKERVDFKIRTKVANWQTGRIDVGMASNTFSKEKKTAKKTNALTLAPTKEVKNKPQL